MTTGIKPWVIQEDIAKGTTLGLESHSTHIYTPGGYIERVIGSLRTTRSDGACVAVVVPSDPTIILYGPAATFPWADAQHDFDVRSGDGLWPPTVRYAQNLYIAWQRIGSEVTIGDDVTVWWGNLVVIQRRYNYAGGLVDAAAHPELDVQGLIHDLMGRGLALSVEFDPNRVEPGTAWGTTVPHAAWWSGVSAREVLTYANTYAPNLWWAVGEPGPSGLPKFWIGRWDGPARYVFAPGMPGVELSGGADSLANRCLVRYVGTTFGSTKTVWVAEVRANLRALSASGQVRTMTLDLTSEGLLSTDDARVRGVAALAQAARERTAGKVTINGPVFDRQWGRMVEPWEMQAGCTAVVCDAPLSYGRSTSLDESIGADGVAVFRVAGVAYEASGNRAVLSLDGGSRSLISRMKLETAPRRYDAPDARI